MKIRLTCTSCHASFLVTDEQLGRHVSCPKCGGGARIPGTIEEVSRLSSAGHEATASPSVRPAEAAPAPLFVAAEADEERPKPWRRRLIPFLIGAIGGLIVAALILWPMLRPAGPDRVADRRDAPRPIDPVERTARGFLDALVSGDDAAIGRLSTVADPPAIASYDDVRRDPVADVETRGSFAPIAALHDRIASKYSYDPAIGRFQNANPLGVAADFMDQAEQVRRENEAGDVFSRIAGGTADEQLDAAVQYAESFARLTQNILPREELVPTYAQIVRDSEPPLPPDAEALALRFGEDKETWVALLGRPFFTIRADGPFVLEEAEVVANVRDRLASAVDPDRRLRLRLLRFRLDAIDTGWKVVSARREEIDEPPTVSPGGFTSPGLEEGP